MIKKVQWGVLGVANIAVRKVIPAMQSGKWSEVTAIASRDLEKARRAADELGIPKAYGSYEELLADPNIEAVYNPLPNHLHVPWSIKTAEAGKHVLCEKPISLTVKEAISLLKTRDRTRVKIEEAFMVRTHPQWLGTLNLLKAGRIGTVRSVVGYFSYNNQDPQNIRNISEYGGGGLMDIGCYLVYFSRLVFGTEPKRVMGLIEEHAETRTDVLTSALLDFPSGQSIFTCSTRVVPYQRVQILGTRGRMEIEIPINAPVAQPCRVFIDDGSDLSGRGIETLEFQPCDQYTVQGDLFSQSIREDKEPAVPLEESLKNMAVIEAIFRSAKSNQWEVPSRLELRKLVSDEGRLPASRATMKVLFIGGTGIISAEVSRQAIATGLDLYLLNRGLRRVELPGSHHLTADIRRQEDVFAALQGLQFDVVVDWIAYTPDDIERDLALFQGRVKQYIFISSASAYQKPPAQYLITEATPLDNRWWDYSRNKIACEERLMRAHHEEGFPATIVRPSQTYDLNFPVAIGGGDSYTLADRLMSGRSIIVHGDGAALWVVTHAEDFGRGFLGLIGNGQAIGHTFHITSDEVLTWDQIYRTIAEALGVEANIVHIPSDFIARVAPRLAGTLLGDKKWSVVFDNSKIKTFVPGFQAVIPFREGIRRTLAWFDADEKRRRVDETLDGEMNHIVTAYAGQVIA